MHRTDEMEIYNNFEWNKNKTILNYASDVAEYVYNFNNILYIYTVSYGSWTWSPAYTVIFFDLSGTPAENDSSTTLLYFLQQWNVKREHSLDYDFRLMFDLDVWWRSVGRTNQMPRSRHFYGSFSFLFLATRNGCLKGSQGRSRRPDWSGHWSRNINTHFDISPPGENFQLNWLLF